MAGPLPMRSEELTRDRSRMGRDRGPDIAQGQMFDCNPDDWQPGEDWHPIAVRVFNSLKTSGIAEFYQDSDWAIAWTICEDLSRYKEPLINRETGEEYYKRSGQMLQTIMSTLLSLGMTEGDRRRMRIELQKPDDRPDLQVVAINDAKSALGLQS